MTFNRRSFGLVGAVALAAAGLAIPAAFANGEEEAAKAAVAGFYQAYLDADGKKLDALFAEQLSFGHSDGRLETKKQVIDAVTSKKTIYKKFNFSNESVAVTGPNAVVRHRVVIEAEADGKPTGANVHVLQVWQKQGDAWKLLARQAVPART